MTSRATAHGRVSCDVGSPGSEEEDAEPLQGLRGLDGQLSIDCAEGTSYVLSGEQGTYIRLSPSAYHLLKARRAGVSFGELAAGIGAQSGREVEEAEVEAAYNTLIGRIRAIRARAQHPPAGFLFRLKLIPAPLAKAIGTLLAPAFHPLVACLLFGIAVTVSIVPSWNLYKIHGFFGIGPAPGDFWWAYGLFLLSVLFHEFGHASACVRFGARPSEIGFTLYLIFPAFYSDVTSAWELRRWQRVIIDLGGVYFQGIVGATYLAIYRAHPWEPLWLAWALIAGSMIFMLNPALKFDGYWIVADALGVTNLGRQPMRITRHLLSRLRGRPVRPLPWSLGVTGVLGLYTLVSFGIWVYLLLFAMPLLWRHVAAYPAILQEIVTAGFGAAGHPLLPMLRELSISTLMVCLAGLLTWRLIRPLWTKARSWMSHSAVR